MDDFSGLQGSVTKALVATTRSVSELTDEDLSFHRSLDASIGGQIDQQNARLLALTERLLGVATANTEAVRPPSLKDLDSVDGNWRAVVDVIDSLLERADTALDEFTGAVKRLSPGAEQAAKSAKTSRITSALKDLHIAKPQLLFADAPPNQETGPFKPLLLDKPHALIPLDTHPIASDAETQASYASLLSLQSRLGVFEHVTMLRGLFLRRYRGLKLYPKAVADEPSRYRHPYQLEIEQYRYPSSVYTHSEPIPYHPFEATTGTLVDTEEAMWEMLEELKQAKEIAIDLEHHDTRSYIGIVCLMQISTRDKDWIVDTLKPWRRELQCLNEVFADPGIVKVLHGAYMDIVWLQRDLGLYMVGLFDTHHAARALGYEAGSLAFLLKKFANVNAQKQYQLADWRIRPLPQELLDYARSDTHYLLYIFDRMRNELIERSTFDVADHEEDKLWEVLQKSSDTALQRYEHPVYDFELGQGSMGWYKPLSRTPALFTKEQFAVYREVHRWRDDVAREQDDSIHYVMPNHHLLSIARAMPMTRLELMGCVAGLTQTARLKMNELLAVIKRGKAAGATGPEMLEVFKRIEPQLTRKSTSTPTLPAATALAPPPPAPSAVHATAAKATASSVLPLRSPISAFWGPAFTSSAWTKKQEEATGMSLAVPMPALAAEVFADADPSPPSAAEPEPPRESLGGTTEPTEENEDVFVLRELRRKRKREVPDSVALQADEVTFYDEKAEQRKARKEARRAAKAAAANRTSDSLAAAAAAAASASSHPHPADEQLPFDYASAPSLLSAPREDAAAAKERRKKEKQLKPFAKALDAPKGLPRAQKETAGKSMTFGRGK